MKKINRLAWFCWNCGEKIGERLTLWSLNERIDRVFIICDKEACRKSIEFADGNPIIVDVARI